MKRSCRFAVLLPLVASVASASPCFKLPRGFKPQPPSGTAAVLVVATPSPLTFSPVAEWRDISADEIRQINDELANLIAQGLQSKGIQARAVSGGAEALLYQSKGRVCAKPDEAERIRAEVSTILMNSSLQSAVAVRIMAHRQQYRRVHVGQLVNREEAIAAKDGSVPLPYTANGEVHVLGGDGSHLNYFFVLDSWGIKRLPNDQFKMLNRSDWLAELATQILTTLAGGPAVR